MQTSSPHTSTFDGETKRIFRNMKTVDSDGTPINKANFSAQFVAARRVVDGWWDIHYLLSRQAVDRHGEETPSEKNLDEERPLIENKLSTESTYDGLSQE